MESARISSLVLFLGGIMKKLKNWTFLLLLLFFSACYGQRLGPLPDWSPNERLNQPLDVISIDGVEGVILPLSLAPVVLFQCSRPILGEGDSFWIPEISQIKTLEEKLPQYIFEQARGGPIFDEWKDLHRFKRQYAGIIREGKKSIYVNFFPKADSGGYTEENWRHQVILACEGGQFFFGVEYDVQLEQFIHVASNGVA